MTTADSVLKLMALRGSAADIRAAAVAAGLVTEDEAAQNVDTLYPLLFDRIEEARATTTTAPAHTPAPSSAPDELAEAAGSAAQPAPSPAPAGGRFTDPANPPPMPEAARPSPAPSSAAARPSPAPAPAAELPAAPPPADWTPTIYDADSDPPALIVIDGAYLFYSVPEGGRLDARMIAAKAQARGLSVELWAVEDHALAVLTPWADRPDDVGPPKKTAAPAVPAGVNMIATGDAAVPGSMPSRGGGGAASMPARHRRRARVKKKNRSNHPAAALNVVVEPHGLGFRATCAAAPDQEWYGNTPSAARTKAEAALL